MTRSSNVQKWVAEADRLRDRQDKAIATYVDRLMETLQRAQEEGFTLTIEAGMFVLEDHGCDFHARYILAPFHTDVSNIVLRHLGDQVAWKREVRMRNEKRRQLRETALAKLSREEREVLGLHGSDGETF